MGARRLREVAMMDREGALGLVRRVLALSPAEQTELVLSSRRTELTRFAGNAITQNVANADETLSIRLLAGRREGKADTNQFDEKSLRRAIEAAWDVVRLAKEDPLLPPLVEKQPAYRTQESFARATAETSPAARARVVADACARCKREGLDGSGIFVTGAGGVAYANSRGVFGYHPVSDAVFSLTSVGDHGGSEGWAIASDADVEKVDVERVVRTSIEKAQRGKRPQALAPGRYTVILEPAAVSELMLFFSWLGFGAQAFQEGRSYLVGKLGQKLFSSKLTVRDDAYHDAIRGMPFDYEGTAREAVTLIEKGVAKGLVWDRRSAAREQNGKRSTGHGLPQPNSWGPQADAIVVEGGEASVADLVRSTERGLLVTKFHYCNVVDPMELSITGMTRSGLYLVEDGEVTRPVKNFRFTVSLLDIFSERSLEALGACERTGGALFSSGASFVPAMKIRDFNMTSGTDF
jgi:predicted Zn-dependent protease